MKTGKQARGRLKALLSSPKTLIALFGLVVIAIWLLPLNG
jgi:hypothetical protein